MKERGDHFVEEYVYLADVTHDAALIAWGAFFFDSTMKLLEDSRIHMLEGCSERRTSIGWTAESYGQMHVAVTDPAGKVTSVNTPNTYCWVQGLAADTEYSYRVQRLEADGSLAAWGGDELFRYDPKVKELFPTGRRYDLRFRTFPDPTAKLGGDGLVFAVIGDTGTGDPEQVAVARALEVEIARREIRFILSVGDTIYSRSGGSGDDDFEWLTTYFQPYRTIIDHIPVYPCTGNHDTSETPGEKQQDRLALYDNLLVPQRFRNAASHKITGRDASVGPGLFYRFQFGSDVEIVCLDTSKESPFPDRLFEHKAHSKWLATALEKRLAGATLRIPFMHHPPYCKGPKHGDERDVQKHIVDPCRAGGIRALFAGHEHNFQCIDSPDHDLRTFVTGGGGGFRDGDPNRSTDGYINYVGGRESGHFVVVTVARDLTAHVEPIDSRGRSLALVDAAGDPAPRASKIPFTP